MKSILIIVPFDNIYPPMNGGMLRCFHIMQQLAKHFQLTAIIHQDKESFLKCTNEFPALSRAFIYSTKGVTTTGVLKLFPPRLENAFRSRWYERKLFSPADSSLIAYYPVLTQLLKKQQFDAVILENLATLNAVKIIRRYDSKVKIVYNAHNVDSSLAMAAVERNEMTAQQLISYQRRESNFHTMVDGVLTCSQKDKATLEEMNGGKLKAFVVPNGVHIPSEMYNAEVRKDIPAAILFCGSLWSVPNAEGLQWFCRRIWPLVLAELPYLKLLVVGIGEIPEQFADIKATINMDLIGEVIDLNPWYQKAGVSIVPLLTGSGTRLKILEAMGMGVPVIATTRGAEGIAYSAGENIIIADEAKHFAEKLIMLLKDKNLRINLANDARALVKERYDWDVVGEALEESIKAVINPS